MNDPGLATRMQREGALAELLQDFFGTEELSRLIAYEFGDAVHASVPWKRARATVVEQVVRSLSQRGLVGQLIVVLRRERAFRSAEIEPVAAMWSPSLSSSPSAPLSYNEEVRHRPPDMSSRSWAVLLVGVVVVIGGSLTLLSTATRGDEAVDEIAPVAEHPSTEEVAPSDSETIKERRRSKRDACCATCGTTSKVCGNGCISLDKECHQGPGCACS